MINDIIYDIIYDGICVFVFIILIMDIIVAVTANFRNAGKFIRRLRYWAYSITPAMYVIMILLVIVISECFHIGYYVLTMTLVLMLVLGCCIAYAERFFTRRKPQKKRIPARRLKPLKQKERIKKL